MKHATGTVYLVPCFLDETALQVLPGYIIEAVRDCQVIFAENERTARRFLKAMDRSIVIDDYEWFAIHKAEQEQRDNFSRKLKEGKNVAIISEAGCPGIADPGQVLVQVAQEMQAIVRPLVGPSSILLALMASGMNGQQFSFTGYLPIELNERIRMLRELEAGSQRSGATQIFIETPYRNNQLVETILKTCKGTTRLCIAANLTAANEQVYTKTISEWRSMKPDYHKQPAIFLLQAG